MGSDFQILFEESNTSGPSSTDTRVECQFWCCGLCLKNWRVEDRKYYYVNFCFRGIVNLGG